MATFRHEIHDQEVKRMFKNHQRMISPVRMAAWMGKGLQEAYKPHIEQAFESNSWAPLTRTTMKIRDWRGEPSAEPNVETGQFKELLSTSFKVVPTATGVMYVSPDMAELRSTPNRKRGDLSARGIKSGKTPNVGVKWWASQNGQHPGELFGRTEVDIPARPVRYGSQAGAIRAKTLAALGVYIRQNSKGH